MKIVKDLDNENLVGYVKQIVKRLRNKNMVFSSEVIGELMYRFEVSLRTNTATRKKLNSLNQDYLEAQARVTELEGLHYKYCEHVAACAEFVQATKAYNDTGVTCYE